MKRRQTGRTSLSILLGFILAIMVVASPGEVQGQMRTLDVRQQEFAVGDHVDLAVPLRLVEDIDLLTRLKWTLQVLFVPRTIDDVNPLYAYEPRSVEGQEIRVERVGPVAMVGRCSGSSSVPRGHADHAWDRGLQQPSPGSQSAQRLQRSHVQVEPADMTWCARYFGDVTAAHGAAYAADAAGGDYYFATTYPLPNVEAAQRFVAEYGLALRDYYRWVEPVPEGDR